ncbi:MAG: hypothetical protein R3182_06035, partial [Draconibacterium sp.]|nr:hypothetical protein [Draconibacterium sp.]
MKKVFIIILIIFIILVGTLFAIPVIFKQKVLEVAKNTLNRHLNAEVEFADMNLSLFKDFPNATVEFKDVFIKGINQFEDDTLLSVKGIRSKMDLASIFRKSEMSVEEIILNAPKLNLKVSEDGKVNWELTSEQKPVVEGTTNAESGGNEFQLQLEKIEVRDATLTYNDSPLNMSLGLEDVDLDISGKMFGNLTQLQTRGTVDDFSLKSGGVNYISNTSLDITTLLDVDFDRMKFSIAENELLVNRLPLELQGSIETPADKVIFDLELNTKESDFENFLALVPPVYEEYLKDIKTSGSATITGIIEGFYADDTYPAFDMKMKVNKGNFHYSDMPEQIINIKADVNILKPQGELDLTEIKINEAHAQIRNNPIDLSMKITHPVSDPYFDGAFIGKVNLTHLKDALPIDSVNIAGIIDANLFAKGNYSAIEKEEYDKITSDGIVLLDNFMYDSPDLTQRVFVPKGQLDFSPENINLSEFQVKVGQSDFNLSGKVFNYLNYILKDGTLEGNLFLNSNLVNLNELLRLQVVKETAEESQPTQAENTVTEELSEEVLAFDVPGNIDITFRSNINRAVFDRLLITQINGLIHAADESLVLNNLSMNMLDGKLKMNGSYKNTDQNQPYIDFGFDINEFDIPLMYKTLTGIQRMIPVAGKSYGKISSSLGMK